MGALVALIISHVYYVKASEDLIVETQQLRSLHNTTLGALQNLQNKNATFQLARDAQGDFTKMGVTVTVPAPEVTTQLAQ